jgi:hypothetical protein
MSGSDYDADVTANFGVEQQMWKSLSDWFMIHLMMNLEKFKLILRRALCIVMQCGWSLRKVLYPILYNR